MKQKELNYNILLHACRHLLATRGNSDAPTPAEQHCFILLWQAQVAIIHDCDIFDNEAIQANLATSGFAVKGDVVIALGFSHFGG